MSVIYGAESELPEEIAGLLAYALQGQQAWVDGAESEKTGRQHDEMTIYGPFGGPIGRQRDGLPHLQAQARAPFQGGTSAREFVQAIAADDVVILILLEINSVKFAGRDGRHAWNLRVTEVYRRDGEGWQRLHRHADPLIRRRGLDDTLALLEG